LAAWLVFLLVGLVLGSGWLVLLVGWLVVCFWLLLGSLVGWLRLLRAST